MSAQPVRYQDLSGLAVREFGLAVSLTSEHRFGVGVSTTPQASRRPPTTAHSGTVCLASLAIPVGGIVGVRPKKQVVGPYAQSIVTVVADDPARRDRAGMHLVGEPMDPCLTGMVPWEADHTVPGVMYGACPDPTAVRFITSLHVIPESIRQGHARTTSHLDAPFAAIISRAMVTS